MAGLRKAKKYDWKDSNMALFGSDTERKVKKESAMCEPAWEGAGQEVGLQIWRIEKFIVKDWPKEDYGKFHTGDSYIILYSYKENESEAMKYDLHFWIGKESSQDEYGTAAYKTVELDTFLDDLPVQHREVQEHESTRFKSYFGTVQYLKGGVDTGFRHVEPKEYVPRLLRICRTKNNTTVSECAFSKKALDSGDVFILDNGLEIVQWNGSSSNGFERNKAASYCQALESERGHNNTKCVEEGQHSKIDEIVPDDDIDDDKSDDEEVEVGDMKLFKISDADGSIGMDEVKTGTVTMADLGSDDVFLVDTGMHVFVYVGANASIEERRNGLPYACNYVNTQCKKPWTPCTVVREGDSSQLENEIH